MPVTTFLGRVGLERGDVASVAYPLVHAPIGVASLLGQLVPVLGLREQFADGALRQTEHVTREQPLTDVVAAQDLAHVLRHVRRVQRHLPNAKETLNRLFAPPTGNQGLKTPFCVPTDELLQAKADLLSEGGQSLNSIFADCFGDWFIGIPFVGDDVVAQCISKLH